MNQTVLRVYSATKSTLTTPEPDRYVMYNISTATRFMCVCLHDIFILLDFRSIQLNRWQQQAISGSRFKNYLLCQCCTCSRYWVTFWLKVLYFLPEGCVLNSLHPVLLILLALCLRQPLQTWCLSFSCFISIIHLMLWAASHHSLICVYV